ncbi:hypothetical protein [Achromobacter sp. Root170]
MGVYPEVTLMLARERHA